MNNKIINILFSTFLASALAANAAVEAPAGVKQVERKKAVQTKAPETKKTAGLALESRLAGRELSYDSSSGKVSIYNKKNQTRVLVDESGKIYNNSGKELTSGVSSVVKDNLKEIVEWGKQYKSKKAEENAGKQEPAKKKQEEPAKYSAPKSTEAAKECGPNYKAGIGTDGGYTVASLGMKGRKSWLMLDVSGTKSESPIETVSKTRAGARFDAYGNSVEQTDKSMISVALEYFKKSKDKKSRAFYAGPALYIINNDKTTTIEEVLQDKAGNVLSSNKYTRDSKSTDYDLKARVGMELYKKNFFLNVSGNLGLKETTLRATIGYRK